ncbi:LysR family transcriptional regulator [Rhizobium sp. MHM7A]|uniref:LysR family transcriptional regulator n=1 Tax=Rhizobium sp. MHM7A TaxID=2583233 RepID=UPI00110661F6|nr:LysR family transcriptional regulator [Rhizobium sp. MHM7A]TLX10318.1 LysR family transcriptional regulator [Rhizobium sp. MHM7A]
MSINRISLYHLESLVWIARLGTFAAAAERLNTTQPAISARISELEERLSAKLFRRNGRTMALTPAGRELVREYTPIWDQLQAALLRSAGFDQIRGIVRIGSGEIAAATCLPQFVANMKRRWHDLTFEIDIQLTAQLIQSLVAGKIDIAFAASLVVHPALVATPIGPVELIWVAAADVANRLEQAQDDEGFPLWSLPSHSPIYEIMRSAVERLPVRRRAINYCNNVRAIVDIVSQGDGFALLPAPMIRPQLDDDSLRRVFADIPVQPIIFHVVSRAAESDAVVHEVLHHARSIRLSDT